MSVDLGWLATEARRIKLAARRVDRAAQQLLEQPHLELQPGDRLDDPSEVIGFLRLALGSNEQGAVITVSQPDRAQTESETHNGNDLRRRAACR